MADIAEESRETKRARKKLQKRLEALDQKITPQALKKQAIQIRNWIAKHAQKRVILREKSIALFDENEHAAPLSMRIAKIVDQLKQQL
jgi:hypothetical protein